MLKLISSLPPGALPIGKLSRSIDASPAVTRTLIANLVKAGEIDPAFFSSKDTKPTAEAVITPAADDAAGACGGAAQNAETDASPPSTSARYSSGTRYPDWTADEDAQLREFYRRAYEEGDTTPQSVLAERLGRTLGGVRSRADKLGISQARAIKGGFVNQPRWTKAEEALLRELYPTVRMKQLLERFPGRSKGAIFNRAHQLGLVSPFFIPWTDEHLRALRIAFDRGIAIADVAAAMGRKAMSVSKYATKHGMDFGMRPLVVEPLTLRDILAFDDPAIALPARVDPRRGRPAKQGRKLIREVRRKAERQERDANRVTGAQLAAEIDQLLRSEPRIAKKRIGTLICGGGGGVEEIRRTKFPTRQRVERVRAVIANPPPEIFTPVREAKVPSRPRRSIAFREDRQRLDQAARERATDIANSRRAAALKRAHAVRANELIDAGEKPGAHAPVSLKIAFNTMAAARAQMDRIADPLEQAKNILRRRYTPVCSMSVYGGSSNLFIVGSRKDVTEKQLLEMAADLQRKLAA